MAGSRYRALLSRVTGETESCLYRVSAVVSKQCHLSMRNQEGEVPMLPGNTRCLFSPEIMSRFLLACRTTAAQKTCHMNPSHIHSRGWKPARPKQEDFQCSALQSCQSTPVLESQDRSLVLFPGDLLCFKNPTSKAATKEHSARS